jgi:serine/threonine protein kinase
MQPVRNNESETSLADQARTGARQQGTEIANPLTPLANRPDDDEAAIGTPLANDPAQQAPTQVEASPPIASCDKPLNWVSVPHADLHDIRLSRTDHEIQKGGCGEVAFYAATDGRQFAGKTSKTAGNLLYEEYGNFRKVYDRAGKHANLVNAYGIINVAGNHVMLLDRITGPNGAALRTRLRACKENGHISHAQYWGAIQFIGRRLMSVANHLAKAGIAHCDIKPENFLIDEKTGEPIVVDLGNATEKNKSARGTLLFCAPEQDSPTNGVDERTDVFGIATTLFALAEGESFGQMRTQNGLFRYPNTGLFLDLEIEETTGRTIAGKPNHLPGTATVGTAYTSSVRHMMQDDKENRPSAREAVKAEFFDDPLTDDDTARATLRRVATFDMAEKVPKRTARIASAEEPGETSVVRTVMSLRQKQAIRSGRQMLRKSTSQYKTD